MKKEHKVLVFSKEKYYNWKEQYNIKVDSSKEDWIKVADGRPVKEIIGILGFLDNDMIVKVDWCIEQLEPYKGSEENNATLDFLDKLNLKVPVMKAKSETFNLIGKIITIADGDDILIKLLLETTATYLQQTAKEEEFKLYPEYTDCE